MLEVLALYVFLRCYGLFDPGAYSSWQRFQAQIAARTSEQCIAEFRGEVERMRSSQTAQRAAAWWSAARQRASSSFDEARLRQAAALTSAQLDAVLADVRENIRRAQAAGR